MVTFTDLEEECGRCGCLGRTPGEILDEYLGALQKHGKWIGELQQARDMLNYRITQLENKLQEQEDEAHRARYQNQQNAEALKSINNTMSAHGVV